MKEHPKMKNIYIGIDCHKYTHTACIINCFNEIQETITFNNDNKGYGYLIETVNKHKEDLNVIFGLEDTKHLGYGLASFLTSKDFIVKNVNSNLTYNERKKSPIIYKNDDYDSYCVAKVLLDELDKLPNATSDEIYWTLKQLVKMRKAIVSNNVEVKNKLHAQLLHHYPNYNKVFKNIDGITALSIFEKYPSPDLLLKEDFPELVSFINTSSKGKLGIKKANQLIELISEYDIPNKVYQTERNNIIVMLIGIIKDNNDRLVKINNEIISVYDKIGKKLHTYPCLDKITASYILTEIGNVDRFKNSSKLARYAGISPIEYSSGSKDKVLKNEYGNRNLNSYIYTLACRSLLTGKNKDKPFNSIFKEYYYKKTNSGKTKHQAIICVMRRLINILYYILKYDKEYVHPSVLSDECNDKYTTRKAELDLKAKKKAEFKNTKI